MSLSDFLPRALERLAMDVMVGRYGDPHGGFVVLVYPDREPEIVALTNSGSGAASIRTIVDKGDKRARTNKEPGERFFTVEDLREAEHALHDAHAALTYRHLHVSRAGDDDSRRLGQRVADHIAATWLNRRERQIASEMEKAAHAEKYSERCPHCRGSFTKRGLPMHLAKSAVCSKREAAAS